MADLKTLKALKKRLGHDRRVRIVPYRGYGNADTVYFSGRVQKDRGELDSSDNESLLDNLADTLDRFGTDEVEGARLRARFRGEEQLAETNDEGYFEFTFGGAGPPGGGAAWHEAELELLDPQSEGPVVATAQALVPPASARFGVISDIDDTVIWTNVGDKLDLARMVFLENVRSRLPFKGVGAFYHALREGHGGGENNPIFYVSSSPWNLYDLLKEFLELNDIPAGPILLKDIGKQTPFEKGHQGHKLSKIEPLLRDFYPRLPFVLIGDSGEQDPEIYSEVVRKYPDRVLAIYIRSVNPSPRRIAEIDELVKEVSKTSCQLVLVPDSEFAATHAAGERLISTDALPSVRSEKQADESAPAAGG